MNTSTRQLTDEDKRQIVAVYLSLFRHLRWLVLSLAAGGVSAFVASRFGGQGAWLTWLALAYGTSLPAVMVAPATFSQRVVSALFAPVVFIGSTRQRAADVAKGFRFLKANYSNV